MHSKDHVSFRAVLLADYHLSNRLPHARTLPGEGGITDRFKDQLEVGRKAIEVAKQIGGPIIVVGDFYDKAQLDPITLTESIRMMVDSGVEWWILPGNHDSASLSGGRFNVEALGIMGCDKVRTLSIDDCFVRSGWELRFLPFASIPENREQLAILRDRPIVQGSKRILFAHQAIFGCKVDSGWIDDKGINPEEMCRGWDEVVLGHFHDRQEFGPPANHREGQVGRYVGSPMQFKYNDSGSLRGGLVMTLGLDGSASFEHVDLGARKFWQIERGDSLPEGCDPTRDFVRMMVRSLGAERDVELGAAEHESGLLGANVQAKHVQIYQHEARGASGLAELSLPPAALVERYVTHESVVTGAMDRRELIRVGREIADRAQGGADRDAPCAKILQFRCKDLLLFSEVDRSLENLGLIFVFGRNDDTDGAQSNGSGKSSLAKAIAWIVYGEAIDGEQPDGFIRSGCPKGWGEVDLDVDGKQWTIRRSRTRGTTNLSLISPAGDPVIGKKREIQEQIERLMGMSFRAWRTICCHASAASDPNYFSAPWCGDATRKEILHACLGTGSFDPCVEEVKRRKQGIDELAAAASVKLAACRARLSDVDVAAEQRRCDRWESDKAKRVRDLQAKLSRIESAPPPDFAPLEADVVRCAALVPEAEQAEHVARDALDEASSSLQVAREEAASCEAAADRIASQRASREAREARSAVTQALAKHERAASDLAGLSGDACPTCGSALAEGAAHVHVVELQEREAAARDSLRSAKLHAKQTEERVAKLEALVAAADSAAKVVARCEKTEARRKLALSEAGRATIAAQREASKAREALAVARESASADEAKRTEAKSIAKRLREVQAERCPHESALANATEREKFLRAEEAALRSDLADLAAEGSLVGFWSHGFSSQGLPSMLLDGAMAPLTERANHWLAMLTDGDISGAITTQKELKSGESRDRIALEWTIEGLQGVTPSDAQRTKIRIACDLSLMDLAEARGIRSDLAVFDEVLDGCDDVGTQRMLQLLATVRERRSTVLVISHEAGMSEDFEGGLCVVKSGGSSRVESC